MGYNLISSGRLADNGIKSLFRRKNFLLQLESDGARIGQRVLDSLSGLYVFPSDRTQSSLTIIDQNVSDSSLRHRRLAYVNMQDLCNVRKHANGIPNLTPSKDSCRAGHLGKAHKLPSHSHFKESSKVYKIVDSNIMGDLQMSFPNRYRYVCTFIDAFSRYTYLGFLRQRSD